VLALAHSHDGSVGRACRAVQAWRCVLAYDQGCAARRSDHSDALTLLNWPDALVRIAGPGPTCYIQADSGAKIRRRCHLIVTFDRTSTRKIVEIRGFEPLTFCMPFMAILSDGILLSRITAGQNDIGVWVRRAASAVAWMRCHLLCHWLGAISLLDAMPLSLF